MSGTEAFTESLTQAAEKTVSGARANDAPVRCQFLSLIGSLRGPLSATPQRLVAWLFCLALAGSHVLADPPPLDQSWQPQDNAFQSTATASPETTNQQASGLGPQISIQARLVHRWQIGDAQASLLEGDVQLQRGETKLSSKRVLLVSDGPQGRVRNRLVIEKDSDSNGVNRSPATAVWISKDVPSIDAPNYRGKPKTDPFLLQFLPDRAVTAIGGPANQTSLAELPPMNASLIENGPTQAAMHNQELGANGGAIMQPGGIELPTDSAVQQTQFPQVGNPPAAVNPLPAPNGPPPEFIAPAPAGQIPPATSGSGGSSFQLSAGSGKMLQIGARDGTREPELTHTQREGTKEWITMARGGVSVQINDVNAQLPSGQAINFASVSLSADNVVVWGQQGLIDLFQKSDQQPGEIEMYLEGDVVFRAGENIIYAQSMYYNVDRQAGTILDAEAITSIDAYQGVARVKAEVLQQIGPGYFRAFDAAVTSSRMGVPKYWLQSEQLQLLQQTMPVYDPTTGTMQPRRTAKVSADNSFVFLGGVPVLYWPTFSTTLSRPAFYLTNLKVGSDSAFGTQILLDWDLFQLLGYDKAPENVTWEMSTDYLSKRGFALGTQLEYDTPRFFRWIGPTRGRMDFWGIHDTGFDQLGRDRMMLTPETSTRGRWIWDHRQQLGSGWELVGNVGWISDRNFMEQYLEREWDNLADPATGLRLRRYAGNHLLDIHADFRVNPFFQDTQRLPAIDHYMLGGSILNDRVSWQMNNHISYSDTNVADIAKDPAEAAENFALPGEADRSGLIASTKQELSTVLPVGPFNLRPIASLQASYYGQDINGNSTGRLLGQGGLQMNLPMMKVDRSIHSKLLNMNGLAHKVDWRAEYWYAKSDQNLDDLPLYNSLDDNAQEQFRRRFIGDTFGGALPARFDPRTYAFRQGIQTDLVSPSDDIVDNLQSLTLGMHHRFQTKRGIPGQERIVDLIQFDLDTLFFPDADQNNYGESIGPTVYDFRYHLGDRYSLISDGYFDWFGGGLRSVSAGLRSSRPGTSNWYVGLLSLEGPISSTVLRTTVDYRMNEKWIFSGGTTYDFGSVGNIGQSYGLTRIGESMLVRLRMNIDHGRDTVGLGFLIEPRFFARTLGSIGGGMIPPPGIEGLE